MGGTLTRCHQNGQSASWEPSNEEDCFYGNKELGQDNCVWSEESDSHGFWINCVPLFGEIANLKTSSMCSENPGSYIPAVYGGAICRLKSEPTERSRMLEDIKQRARVSHLSRWMSRSRQRSRERSGACPVCQSICLEEQIALEAWTRARHRHAEHLTSTTHDDDTGNAASQLTTGVATTVAWLAADSQLFL